MREEERIRRERQKIDDEFRFEEEKKKAKFSDIQKANAQLMQNKNAGEVVIAGNKRKIQVLDSEPGGNFQNHVVDKAGMQPDIFGKAQSVMG